MRPAQRPAAARRGAGEGSLSRGAPCCGRSTHRTVPSAEGLWARFDLDVDVDLVVDVDDDVARQRGGRRGYVEGTAPRGGRDPHRSAPASPVASDRCRPEARRSPRCRATSKSTTTTTTTTTTTSHGGRRTKRLVSSHLGGEPMRGARESRRPAHRGGLLRPCNRGVLLARARQARGVARRTKVRLGLRAGVHRQGGRRARRCQARSHRGVASTGSASGDPGGLAAPAHAPGGHGRAAPVRVRVVSESSPCPDLLT